MKSLCGRFALIKVYFDNFFRTKFNHSALFGSYLFIEMPINSKNQSLSDNYFVYESNILDEIHSEQIIEKLNEMMKLMKNCILLTSPFS